MQKYSIINQYTEGTQEVTIAGQKFFIKAAKRQKLVRSEAEIDSIELD